MPDEQKHASPSHDERTDDRHDTRARWERPSITELPKLTDLTLLTGAGIPGGGSGGSTVF